jgi:hypothetical protein
MIPPMRTATVALALAVVCTAVPAFAGGGGPPAGSLFITPEQVDTTSAGFDKELKSKAVKTLDKTNDQWTLYFVAFLKKAAGAKQVQLVFYDTGVKEHEPTNAFPIDTQANAKILTSSVSFSGDQGFKAGHTYNVMITRLVGGKEDVYARSQVTLK